MVTKERGAGESSALQVPVETMREVFSRNPNVHWTVLDGETIMVNLENGHYFTVNRVGSAIWDVLSEPKTRQELLDFVCRKYRTGRDQAESDLNAFLAVLIRDEVCERGGAA